MEGHLFAEVLILFGRSYNEFQYGRWGTLDLMHHSVFLYAVYLGLWYPPCMPFAWLISHMQALHFPLSLWYLGGKRGSYSNDPRIISICRYFFPMTWFWAASYRFAIMSTSAVVAFQSANFITATILILKGSLMAYLDYGWSKYFIGALTKTKVEHSGKSKHQADPNKLAPSTINVVLYCMMGLVVGFAVAKQHEDL